MKLFAGIRRWWQRKLWESDRMAEERANARRHALESIQCDRCRQPLFQTELPFGRCRHCQKFGEPRPLGKATTR